MPSRKVDTFLTRAVAAQLGVLVRDGSHIGHERSGILTRGVIFGNPALTGIRRLGIAARPSVVLRAATIDGMTPSAE